MVEHLDHDVEIARRTAAGARAAFARKTNARAGVHPRRNLHRQGLLFLLFARAVTGPARRAHHGAFAATGGAGARHCKEALLGAHLAGTATSGAGLRRGAWFGAATVAGVAGDFGGDANGLLGAAHHLFQGDRHVVAVVVALTHAAAPAAPARTSAAEDIAEELLEDVAEARRTRSAGVSAARALIQSGVAILIIDRALFAILEDFISGVDLFELRLGLFVIRVAVRVQLHRQLAIGAFDLRVAGVARNTQNFIQILHARTLQSRCAVKRSLKPGKGDAPFERRLPCAGAGRPYDA
ncbi:putative glutamate dehydrogenase [Magnetofaba australis IT-1]|uniref:Putative glutamate dehydrogenase n=1 Tax=Magnetofaba australis IT-1 TaxID=1434232 RepID=A0A1Y2K1R3_9PROT|nr:putative glutamate dehydrogenase [Magnetofaba australis IT-1]